MSDTIVITLYRTFRFIYHLLVGLTYLADFFQLFFVDKFYLSSVNYYKFF